MNLRVLFEDNHLCIIDKPAGLLAQADRSREPDLLNLVKDYRKNREHKPGNVYVGLVHRLDRPVSGIIVFAKTSKSASRLSEQWRSRTVRKSYLALVAANGARKLPQPGPSVVWTDDLERTSPDDQDDAPIIQHCETRCRCDSISAEIALLELDPMTGRKHQLRRQLAYRGLPILGDQQYGSRRPWPDGIALHACRLEIDHPTRPVRVAVSCPPPKPWHALPFDWSRWPQEVRESDRGSESIA